MILFNVAIKDKQSAIYSFGSSFFGYLELERAGLLELTNSLKKINSWILEKEIKVSIAYKNTK